MATYCPMAATVHARRIDDRPGGDLRDPDHVQAQRVMPPRRGAQLSLLTPQRGYPHTPQRSRCSGAIGYISLLQNENGGSLRPPSMSCQIIGRYS
jgi:hypothetical protein